MPFAYNCMQIVQSFLFNVKIISILNRIHPSTYSLHHDPVAFEQCFVIDMIKRQHFLFFILLWAVEIYCGPIFFTIFVPLLMMMVMNDDY